MSATATRKHSKKAVPAVAKRHAGAPVFNRVMEAVGMAMHVKMANRWRDQLNPLRGLTIALAMQQIEAGERGEYADLQWLYRFVEKRHPILIGLLARYEGGLLKMDWQIKVRDKKKWPQGATQAMADAQAVALRDAYDSIDNLKEALQFLILADFRGFAHLEKHRTADGDILHLEPVPQWNWVRDGINGEWQYNKEARSGTRVGEEVEDWGNFIVRECERPVNELALVNYVFRNMGRKDWAGFIETYGIPPIFLMMPPNVPANKEAEYQSVAEQIIADARGALPHGSDIKSVESASRGVNPFKEFQDNLDTELVIAGTGGKLTMLTESGSGTLAGGEHGDSWNDIVLGKAVMLSELMQRQFDGPEVLQKKFPTEPVLAYFELCYQEETDTSEVVDDVQKLSSAGYQVSPTQVQEKTGYEVAIKTAETQSGTEEDPNREVISDQSKRVIRNRETLQEAAREVVAAAFADDLAPLRERLAAVLKIEDPQILTNRLKALLSEIAALEKDIIADPAAAQAIAQLQTSALFNGMSERIATESREMKRRLKELEGRK